MSECAKADPSSGAERSEVAAWGESAPRRRVAGAGVERVRPRRASRPRPARPEAVAVVVRPPQVERPERVALAAPAGQRVLVRPPVAVPSAVVLRVRRVVAGVVVGALAAALVVGLGLLGDAVSEMRAAIPAGPGVIAVSGAADAPMRVTVETPGTVWDVARRVAPAAQGPELAGVVERIVSANSLDSVVVRPGQVLRIPRS